MFYICLRHVMINARHILIMTSKALTQLACLLFQISIWIKSFLSQRCVSFSSFFYTPFKGGIVCGWRQSNVYTIYKKNYLETTFKMSLKQTRKLFQTFKWFTVMAFVTHAACCNRRLSWINKTPPSIIHRSFWVGKVFFMVQKSQKFLCECFSPISTFINVLLTLLTYSLTRNNSSPLFQLFSFHFILWHEGVFVH